MWIKMGRQQKKKQNTEETQCGECLTSYRAASVVSWDPGEGYRGGGGLGHCETRLIRWNYKRENRQSSPITLIVIIRTSLWTKTTFTE